MLPLLRKRKASRMPWTNTFWERWNTEIAEHTETRLRRLIMQIGMIGLGRMGANMARRLTKGGHQCVVFDRNAETVDSLAKEGPTGAHSLEEVVEKLSAPRAVWVMLPSGAPTEETVMALSKLLAAGDAIIDGGNSFYKDDVRRSTMLKPACIHYLDAGTSGGVWGLERGYCIMIGGDQATVEGPDPSFAP